MKKLNIIVTTHDFISPIRGGGGLRTLKTSIELYNRGHNIKILAPSIENNISGIEVINLPNVSKDNSFLISLSKFFLILFIEIFKTDQIDIIFAHNSVAGIPAVIYGKLFNKKIILDVTDLHSEYMRVSNKKFPMNICIPIISKIEYLSFKFASKVIVVSNVMKKIFIKKGIDGDKIDVVYDGVEVNFFSPEKNNNSNYTIIHHGGIDVQDGVHYIVQAAPFILEKYSDTKFMIIGGGKCLDYVKDMAKRKGVEKSFTFSGWKPYEEMKNYLRQANIGLITRPNTLANNTVLTLKLLEYWASGTAVISSRLMGIEEVSQENKNIIFFQPDNYRDLAKKIISLMESEEKVLELQQNGRLHVFENFDWNQIIQNIADIIEE